MNIAAFDIARLPQIVFGGGRIAELPAHVASLLGENILLVTGKQSFLNTEHWQQLETALTQRGIRWEIIHIDGEPSPEVVDAAVSTHHGAGFQGVLGIGGGSVLDAAKAIAGLLPFGNSVMDHLEGVGKELPYKGPALPFIAVPTTAGTGSEATKNAVLSQQSAEGFKKSFRDNSLVPELALLDPDLLESCSKDLLAANGMDAFTQLLESYVSSRANPFTDALAWSGMQAFAEGFWPAWENKDPEAAAHGRALLAYAALLSGITLAQVGLGSVHGLASPLGAFFPCPHGVVCGTLLAEATEVNIQALSAREPNNPALAKYAQVAVLLSGKIEADTGDLVTLLRQWTQDLSLAKLSDYGMSAADIDKVVANSRGSSMKTNPLVLTDAEIATILQRRL